MVFQKKVKPVSGFKHNENCSLVVRFGQQFLEQKGKLYTYAEYNRSTKSYEPEPRVVDERALKIEYFSPEIENIKKEIGRLQSRITEIDETIGVSSNGEQDKG